MIHDKIRTNNWFNRISSEFLTPSSALSYIGYLNDISGKVTLKVNDGETVQTTCNDSKVIPLTIDGSVINLNYLLGDIFYINSINLGNYTITVSNLGGPELRGKTILLYLNNIPANTTISFGNSEILSVNEVGSYCITFCNLKGTNIITCLSVFETPGLTALVVTPPPSDPLTFKGRAASNAICLSATGNPDPITLNYCMNNDDNWIPYTLGDVITFNQKETVSFSGYNNHFSKDVDNYYKFYMTGTILANGNIQSLMNFSDTCTNDCYHNLFRDCSSLTISPDLSANILAYECYKCMFYNCTSLTSAPTLPATKLAVRCYQFMFSWCTSLTQAPELFNTNLEGACYGDMFHGCTSLKTPPSLPATTLKPFCYGAMFMDCTSLTSAPSLPATTLDSYCYERMFTGCTSLLTAPLLPATNLVQDCYYQMFQYCSNLTSINVGFTDWNVISATYNWVNGVAAEGTFTCPAALNTTTRDGSHVPLNWNIVNPQ